MTIHTLIFSFAPEMTAEDREQFFREIGDVMVKEAGARGFKHRPHLRLAADDHAPVFIASAIAQVEFADLDALAAAFAVPALREFMGRWQAKYPYRVVWANHEPVL